MKKAKLLLSALLIIMIATSCTFAQKSELANKTYPIQNFKSVKSDAVANIIYTQSSSVSARVEGDKELVDKLTITEQNGVLNIGHKVKFTTKNKRKLTIYISSPTIEAIDVEGVGNWTMKGEVKSNDLKINFDGVGNFEALELESNNIKASYGGVGNLTLGGTTESVEITYQGVGNVKADNLKAQKAIIKSSGVGSVKCYASENIGINNTGVGSITYYGSPTVKNIQNSGVGKIKAGK